MSCHLSRFTGVVKIRKGLTARLIVACCDGPNAVLHSEEFVSVLCHKPSYDVVGGSHELLFLLHLIASIEVLVSTGLSCLHVFFACKYLSLIIFFQI